jgi:aldehyde dehydrogenase (NAD+)
MEAAAKNLVPLTLELGGKCPAIVEADASIEVAARRVAWGKFYNAGQTCVAPDYVLVQEGVKERFVAGLRESVTAFFGSDPAASPDYARIVNARHFSRLACLIKEGRLLFGGEKRQDLLYIAPTAMDVVTLDGALMRDEIFGPLLPVLSYRDLDSALELVNSLPHPLTLYFFSRSPAKMEKVLRAAPSGGAIMNDTLVQMTNPCLPFGGSGASGFGRYHGRAGFDAFSQLRGVLYRPFWPDFKFRYPPYKLPLNWLKKLF